VLFVVTSIPFVCFCVPYEIIIFFCLGEPFLLCIVLSFAFLQVIWMCIYLDFMVFDGCWKPYNIICLILHGSFLACESCATAIPKSSFLGTGLTWNLT